MSTKPTTNTSGRDAHEPASDTFRHIHECLPPLGRSVQEVEKLRRVTATLQSRAAKQRNEIGRLTRQVEIEQQSKRDHVFRLRVLLSRALRDDPAWREDAQRELGGGA